MYFEKGLFMEKVNLSLSSYPQLLQFKWIRYLIMIKHVMVYYFQSNQMIYLNNTENSSHIIYFIFNKENGESNV